jgi:hypothetical protein
VRSFRGEQSTFSVPTIEVRSFRGEQSTFSVPTIGIRARMETPPAKDGLKMFDGVGSSSAAVERVVNTNSVEIPLLTKVNYHEWALVMQVSLEAMELWDAVEAVCKERPKDRRAMAAILRAVPSEMKAGLAVKKSAKEAWDAVKAMRVGDDRVKAASVQRLWKEYENVAFRDGETVGDFALRINGLVASLREMGETLEDHRVVEKILRVVPKRLKQVAVAIEMLTDLNTATIEELVGRLRVAEEADNEDAEEGTVEVAGRLYLTEERWEERRRQRNKEKTRGGGARRGRNGKDARRGGNGSDTRRGGNKGDGNGDTDDDASSTVSGSSRRGWSRNRGRCFECGERGHIAKYCCERKKKEETALLADFGETPALL